MIITYIAVRKSDVARKHEVKKRCWKNVTNRLPNSGLPQTFTQ